MTTPLLTEGKMRVERRISDLTGLPVLHIATDGPHGVTRILAGVVEYDGNPPTWAADMLLTAMRELSTMHNRPETIGEVVEAFRDLTACVDMCVALVERAEVPA